MELLNSTKDVLLNDLPKIFLLFIKTNAGIIRMPNIQNIVNGLPSKLKNDYTKEITSFNDIINIEIIYFESLTPSSNIKVDSYRAIDCNTIEKQLLFCLHWIIIDMFYCIKELNNFDIEDVKNKLYDVLLKYIKK